MAGIPRGNPLPGSAWPSPTAADPLKHRSQFPRLHLHPAKPSKEIVLRSSKNILFGLARLLSLLLLLPSLFWLQRRGKVSENMPGRLRESFRVPVSCPLGVVDRVHHSMISRAKQPRLSHFVTPWESHDLRVSYPSRHISPSPPPRHRT